MMRSAFSVMTAVSLSFVSTTGAFAAEKSKPTAAPAVASEVQKITFTNEMVDGKKTWIPADANVKAGSEVEITLINILAEPHGFTVPGLVENIVVGPNETKTVKASAKKAGHYKFSCQLHPAHVGGQINVQ